MPQNQESWISVKWFVEDRIFFCLLLRMTGEVDQAVEGVVVEVVHPSGGVGPEKYNDINKLVTLPGI